jgi:hypothetical protein
MTSDLINDEAKVQKAVAAYTAGEFTSMAKAARFFNAKYDYVKNCINVFHHSLANTTRSRILKSYQKSEKPHLNILTMA